HERRLEEDVSLIIRHQRILNDSHTSNGSDGRGSESRIPVALGGDELLVLLELGGEAGAHKCHVTGAGGAELLQVSLCVNESVEDRIAVDLRLSLEVGGRVVGVAHNLVRGAEDLLSDLVLVVVDESIGLTLENVAPRTVEVESLRLVGERHSGVVAVQLNIDLDDSVLHGISDQRLSTVVPPCGVPHRQRALDADVDGVALLPDELLKTRTGHKVRSHRAELQSLNAGIDDV